jgi:hypothetical protein
VVLNEGRKELMSEDTSDLDSAQTAVRGLSSPGAWDFPERKPQGDDHDREQLLSLPTSYLNSTKTSD